MGILNKTNHMTNVCYRANSHNNRNNNNRNNNKKKKKK